MEEAVAPQDLGGKYAEARKYARLNRQRIIHAMRRLKLTTTWARLNYHVDWGGPKGCLKMRKDGRTDIIVIGAPISNSCCQTVKPV